MNTLRKWTPISCALLSIAAYSVAITCGADAQSEMKPMLSKVAPHRVASAIPSPQSGIKLIEYISQRMHTLKGSLIAAKTATYSAAPQEKSQGPTNPILALRPPSNNYIAGRELDRDSSADKSSNEEQKRRKAEESRTDKSAAGDDFYGYQPVNSGRRATLASAQTNAAKKDYPASTRERDSQAAVFGRMANGPLARSLANLGGALQGVDNIQRAAEGGKDVGLKMKAKAPRAEASYQIASNKTAAGVWERGQLIPQQSASSSVNAKEGRAGNAAGAAGAGGSVVADAVTQEPKAPPMPPAYYRTNYQRVPGSMMSKGISIAAESAPTSSTAGANIRDYRTAPTTIASANVPSASPVMAPAAQGVLIPPPPSVSEAASNSHFNAIQKQKTEIALLPPNVITGIPLVRLGSSAFDANRALTSIKGNKLKQQSIGGWTVYVLHKANSVDPAMQVYVRHGLVEALRIFDNAFIAPDFGVHLNDDVSTVKAKFGEPAFMQDEPECPSAKNYVYPISQVSFELTRASNSPSPKVVSVLIFTVK
ncbi:MAG: hypothetical protein U0103_21985 [Candidatus Obscuribacterales bacterium]|nr:MAG: hypothetical protein EKK48_08655 [Candidatus Melainabacteria bacterium]